MEGEWERCARLGDLQGECESCRLIAGVEDERVIQLRNFFHILAGMIPGAAISAEGEPLAELKREIPELRTSQQLMLVTTDGWNAVSGELRRFERIDGRWRPIGEGMRANVGKKGMGWGIGLHGTFPEGGEQKREGDKRAPAGVFSLDETFGSATPREAGIHKFPYRQMTATFAGVDDSASRYYNRIVNMAEVTNDWKSAEQMLSTDGTYRLGAVIRHNWPAYRGYGSCIFLHIWKGEDIGTSGCTALSAGNVETVLRWLDVAKNPILVQLPRAEYESRKQLWELP